jgi:hypothetical protein
VMEHSIGMIAGNHTAGFEFFGGILIAQTPSNSLAERSSRVHGASGFAAEIRSIAGMVVLE